MQLSRWQRDQNASILSAPCLWIQIQNILRKKSCCLLQVCVYSARPPRLGSKWAAADYTSPTTMTTARNICGTVGPFPCEFGSFFFGINQHHRDPARSRKDRSERGRHHAKGTRYVANNGFWRFICPPLASSRPIKREVPASRKCLKWVFLFQRQNIIIGTGE